MIDILYKIFLSIQIFAIDCVTLLMQPMWFVYSVITDITEVWNATEDEQPEQSKEEPKHIGFNR